MNEPIQLRSASEIQRAHDLLVGILIGECPIGPPDDAGKAELALLASVLCWCLHHDHNPSFAEILAALEQRAHAAGYDFSPDPPPDTQSFPS